MMDLDLKERISQHFLVAEVVKTCSEDVDNTVINNARRLAETCLEPVRCRINRPLIVNSWYRSVKYNASVGGKRSSQHIRGEAVDIHLDADCWKIQLGELVPLFKHYADYDQLIVESSPTAHWLHVSHTERHENRHQYLRIKTH
ncbi:D-Ala-D-Ala carboxypeptidase family metallohydrolase [Segatella paludivivens]|uniref:D-Ala-D-Ala carboxypeptidase family metallohydrolase n=1 Tax=Segatella paludivivens TaxID=185294 RepID=UPI000381A26E|nr:D-Ala-D-Ala carboxypeptidase family metallohydrolase [Segatella paludivivens]